MKRTCEVDGCTRAYRSQGRCWGHRAVALAAGVALPDYRTSEHRPHTTLGTCVVEECNQQAAYQGEQICMTHYLRRLRHGSFDLPARPSIEKRLAALSHPHGDCVIWHGAISSSGYGRFGTEYAHRLSYEAAKGSIPEGLQIDHLCFVKRCINPDHLEAVTQAENLRRQEARMSRAVDGTWKKAS